MELRQLQAFVSVAAERNFTRAAAELSLTQPAVTRQIISLEQELGCRLFDRMGRRVELTVAGESLLGYAVEMLRLSEESRRAVREIAHGISGRLAVAASTTAATYLLPGIIQRYCDAHPQVQLSLRTGLSARVAEMVASGDVDLGVVMQDAPHPRLGSTPVGEYRLALIAPAGHPLAEEGSIPIHPAQIGGCGLILMQPGTALRRHVEQAFVEAGMPPTIVMETDNVETIKRLVAARLGVSIVPDVAVVRGGEQSGLIVRPLAGVPSAAQQIVAIHRTDKYLTLSVKRFIALLKSTLSTPAARRDARD